MNGHLQLMREDLRKAGDAAGEERVDLLLAQLDRVAKIVRGRLERGGWPAAHLTPTNLHGLAEQVLRFLGPSLDGAGLAATLEPVDGSGPPVARTDPDLVEQILLNLLKNAIEALPRGGRVMVTTGAEDRVAFIEVADDGPGLPPETRNQLFQPFVTSKGPEGTGLGLAVSRRLARSLDGELAYVPARRGTRWRLTLPLQERS
jgi:signal transduction histidine kinase